MRKYNKLRGIVRAKQGSQIPKLLLGGTWDIMQLYNQNTIGSSQGLQLPDASDFPLPNLQLPSIDFKPELPETALLKFYNNTLNTALGKPLPKYSSMVNSDKLLQDTLNNKKKFTDTKFGKGVAKAGNFVGNLITDNSEAVMGIGANIARNSVDILGERFGKFDRTTQNIAAFGKLIGGPAGDVISAFATGVNTWGNIINAIGAKKLQDFSVDKKLQERVGGSYIGSYKNINKAGDMAGLTVGTFANANGKNNFISEQRRILAKIAGIDQTNQDMLAMAGNDLNYLNYQMQSNGGYNLKYMGISAKQGGKLLDKISLVKQKRTISNFINLDTKEIEWEPETIIFKTGGIITQDWDIIFELPVKLFKEGGKTKEELETPKIEETSQKNLIPEGALHKNKHHMEHTESLTLKGIPVIDNDGEQQAEIELDEIIFTLEVTKKLEELYKEGTDEAAIEAGKLLVKEILFNTDDRTGLIAKCLEGGKL